MQQVDTVASLRTLVREHRANGETIGLVPTMGALHEGHLSLIRLAAERCDVVVMSLFVNPTQFSDAGDLAHYPRDAERDVRLAGEAGTTVLFAPAVGEVYPDGFATTVTVGGLSERLEGEQRGAAHFAGVATVVSKLFSMVAPDEAFFGQKDAQQVAVVRQMARDLNHPVIVSVGPTVREPDGLAMSSRNVRLPPDDRVRALSLSATLRAMKQRWDAGERDPLVLTTTGVDVMARHGVLPEYVDLVDPVTFEPATADAHEALAVVAAQVGAVRLIDNDLLTSPDPPRS